MEENEKITEEVIEVNNEVQDEKPVKSNKKRNIVAYVFAGLTLPLGLLTILFLTIANDIMTNGAETAEGGNDAANAIGGAIGTVIGIVLTLGMAIVLGIATIVLGSISISILSTCIKQTNSKRRTANIVILSLVGTLLLGLVIGAVLVLFVLH